MSGGPIIIVDCPLGAITQQSNTEASKYDQTSIFLLLFAFSIPALTTAATHNSSSSSSRQQATGNNSVADLLRIHNQESPIQCCIEAGVIPAQHLQIIPYIHTIIIINNSNNNTNTSNNISIEIERSTRQGTKTEKKAGIASVEVRAVVFDIDCLKHNIIMGPLHTQRWGEQKSGSRAGRRREGATGADPVL